MRKITPFLWYDTEALQAARFYASQFRDGSVDGASHTPGDEDGPGAVTMVSFRLAGRDIMAMNAGPTFKFTPAHSFMVECESVEELDALWAGLSEGGGVLMPLDTYPFSERFGWLHDRYGLSWQLSLSGQPQFIMPFMLFVGDQYGRGLEAMELYTPIFPDSAIDSVVKDDSGAVSQGVFTLLGERFMITESDYDHGFTFNEAFSFLVNCRSQEEVDTLWDALIRDGGEPSQCGWLKDRFGVSWQIVPDALLTLRADEDPEKADRVVQAMLKMQKIDVAALEAAYAGSVPA